MKVPKHTPAILAKRRIGLAFVVLTIGCLLSGGIATGATQSPRAKVHGSVNVLYASSLQNILEHTVGPRFHRATGYSFVGYSGASGVLVNEEKAGVIRGDVFISAALAVNNALEGSANGNIASWYILFANSPLVIGYNSKSAFANALRKEPWYQVITRPGFRIGRTDPTVDPKGKLTVAALSAAEKIYASSAVGSVDARTSNIYPEQTLVGLLQSGQLDAGFFYRSEAKAAGIPFVTLGRIRFDASYTVTLLANGPNRAAGASFVHFLLGSSGRSLLLRSGLSVVRPRLIGPRSLVPTSIRTELAS
ncbi:MAG TPA: substrate-binding domain-containing protein [Acidimicrobiales bacterium]|nr:substrate-binding domain-containing protein [Acidimicrobiales bacterium]